MKAESNKIYVLILGGTGAIGISLVEILNKQDKFQVVVTSRKTHENYDNVRFRQGNAHEIGWLQSILQERTWDAIVDFMNYSTEEFSQHALYLLKATKQYVFISSARVYADSGDVPLTESSSRLLDVSTDYEFLKTDGYALKKARQENILFRSGYKNWTIIRPYITFGEKRLQLGVMEKEDWLIPALNGRPIVISKDILNHYTTMTRGDDVAKCIAALLTKQDALCEVFHIASREKQKWQDIFNWYMEAYNDVKGIKPVIYYTEKWDACFGGNYYQWKYDRLYNRCFDNNKICRFAPDVIFAPMEISIKEMAKSFIETYELNLQDLDQNVEIARGILTGSFLPLINVHGKKRKLKVIASKLHIYRLLKKYIVKYHLLWN